jgi:hypothetical protein
MKTHPLAPIVRDMLLPGLAGSLAGLVAAGALIWLDVGNIGTLIRTSADGWVAACLLAAGFVITFGSVAIGAAIMDLGRDDG